MSDQPSFRDREAFDAYARQQLNAIYARLNHLAGLIAAEAGPVWEFGDGEGGTVRAILERAFTEAGLSPVSVGPDAHPTRRQIPWHIRTAVYERDKYRCVTCGTWLNLTLDHIVPWSKGGPDTVENLQTMCRPCNSAKGDR